MLKTKEVSRISIDPSSITSEKVFSTNLRDVVIEAGAGLPINKRVNAFTQRVIEDRKVVNPELDEDKDVSEYFSTARERDKKETKAALQIRDAILNMPDNTVSVWYSPAYKNFDDEHESLGRITVGYNKTRNDIRECESYGLVSDLSDQQMLLSARRLSEFSDTDYELSEPDDLRETAIIFQLPKDEVSPWEFLSNYIPADEVWDAISKGEVKSQIEEVGKDSLEVAREAFKILKYAQTPSDRVKAVKVAEQMMAKRGRAIDHSQLDCPPSGVSSEVYSFGYKVFETDGKEVFTHRESGWTYTDGECRVCEKKTEVGPCSICRTCEKNFD